MSAQRPADEWLATVSGLLTERPELEGVGISYAAVLAVSA